jgi:hypothetical protein
MMENGLVKKASESYLIDALSFTEAEARIVEELNPFISGEFSVSAVRKKNIADVVAASGNKWYDCKVVWITLNEKSGGEKKTKTSIHVQGCCLENALKSLKESLKDALANYEIISVSETSLMDVFVYAVN